MLFDAVALIGLLATLGSAVPTSDMTLASNELLSRAPISTDGSCGGATGATCTGSTFGVCCSSFGFCSNTTTHCRTSFGCQTAYGRCASTFISPDGTCGGTTGYTCTGSTFGTCCSSSGFCGTGVKFCAQGCQPAAGSCTTGSVPSNTRECGPTNRNFTCAGGTLNGSCCLLSRYYGTTAAYYGAGCQAGYGNCT